MHHSLHVLQLGLKDYLQIPTAWCLRNEGVNSVLLGASRTEQLMENIKAIQVRNHTGDIHTRSHYKNLVGQRLTVVGLHKKL